MTEITLTDYLRKINLTELIKYHTLEDLAKIFGTGRTMISNIVTEQFGSNDFLEMNCFGMKGEWMDSPERKSILALKKIRENGES